MLERLTLDTTRSVRSVSYSILKSLRSLFPTPTGPSFAADHHESCAVVDKCNDQTLFLNAHGLLININVFLSTFGSGRTMLQGSSINHVLEICCRTALFARKAKHCRFRGR